ncbi:uncharacterized protein LOC144121589 isoform X1 [Amblyomma americanum]
MSKSKKRCAVPGCSSIAGAPGVSFHQFPARNERKRMWTQALGVPEQSNRPVCSAHFTRDAFEGSPQARASAGYKKRRLRCDAVPTVAGAQGRTSVEGHLTKPEEAEPTDVSAPWIPSASSLNLSSPRIDHGYCRLVTASTQTHITAMDKKKSIGVQASFQIKAMEDECMQTESVLLPEASTTKCQADGTSEDSLNTSLEFVAEGSIIRCSTSLNHQHALSLSAVEPSPVKFPCDDTYEPSRDKSILCGKMNSKMC